MKRKALSSEAIQNTNREIITGNNAYFEPESSSLSSK